jgi:hypothetical protein
MAITTAAVILLAVVTNVVVDPYRMLGTPTVDGFNARKPRADQRLGRSKLLQSERIRPRTLILGNSRAAVGFDPESPQWPAEARPVYNFAVPGAGIRAARDQFLYALQDRKPTRILLGVEFLDFLIAHDKPSRYVPPEAFDTAGRIAAVADAVLSIDAFVDSLRTLWSQRQPFAPDVTALGFMPMREYVLHAREEGYYGLFRQRYLDAQATLTKAPKRIQPSTGKSADAIYLEEILDAADRHGVHVDVVTYPYHAVQLILFERTGLWPAFEEWKALLAQIARARPNAAFWDFAVFDELTQQPIPGPAERPGTSPWYWEGGHFKRELGERVLANIAACRDQTACRNRMPVEPDLLADHLASERRLRDAYRASVPADPFQKVPSVEAPGRP